jgi:hypothetical protein
MMFKNAFILYLLIISSTVTADWNVSNITNDKQQPVRVFSYNISSYSNQVVVLTGGLGSIEDNQITDYDYMGQYFAARGRQVVVLSFDYYGTFAHNTRDAAQNTGNTIRSVIDKKLIDPGFWLYATAGGSLMAISMLDYDMRDSKYHNRLLDVCDRVILISGPVHGIKKSVIENPLLVSLMTSKKVNSLDSLNPNLTSSQRYTQWMGPLLEKNGLRFVYASDDYVYCENPTSPCDAPSIPEAVNAWIVKATGFLRNSQSFVIMGILKILPSGGHDPLKYRANEILNFVSQ